MDGRASSFEHGATRGAGVRDALLFLVLPLALVGIGFNLLHFWSQTQKLRESEAEDKNRIIQIAGQIDRFSEEIIENKNRLLLWEELKGVDVRLLEQRIRGLEQRVTDTLQALEPAGDQARLAELGSIHKYLTSLGDDLGSMRTELSRLQNSFEPTRTELQSLARDIKYIQGDLISLNQKVQVLENRPGSAADDTPTSLKGFADTSESKLSTIELESYKRHRALQEQIDRLADRIDVGMTDSGLTRPPRRVGSLEATSLKRPRGFNIDRDIVLVLRIKVDEHGRIQGVEEIPGEHGLSERAMIALRRSAMEFANEARFEPALLDGKPVPGIATIRIVFKP